MAQPVSTSSQIPASVKDPALRSLLQSLITATTSSAQGINAQRRIIEGAYPTQKDDVRILLQAKSGTAWNTVATIDASGNVTANGGVSAGGNVVAGGYLQAGYSPANSTVAVGAIYSAANIVRCWGFVTLGAATSVTVADGYNIGSISWDNSGTVTVNMAQALANANYAIFVSFQNRAAGAFFTNFCCNATSTTQFIFQSSTVMGTGTQLSFQVIGR